MRLSSITCLSLLALAALSRPVRAQHCHIPADGGEPAAEPDAHHHHHHHHDRMDPPERRTWWLRGATTAVAGAGEIVGESHTYQGVALAVQGGWRRYSGGAALPGYRVSDEGAGVGDVLVHGAIDVVPAAWRLRAGVALSASLPTGDEMSGRGMGHAMAAGGGWARIARGRAALSTGVVFARAFGDGAQHVGHVHAAGWPLVDPMNASELLVDTTGMVQLVHGRLAAGINVTYAAPIDLPGTTRVVPSLVTEVTRGAYSLHLQLGVPVVGDPFVARGTAEVAYQY